LFSVQLVPHLNFGEGQRLVSMRLSNIEWSCWSKRIPDMKYSKILAVGVCSILPVHLAVAQNTAYGTDALQDNTGNGNSAFGYYALAGNTTGSSNTASGAQALSTNTSGNANTAYGFQALFTNILGGGNTAVGCRSLYLNTNSDNTATGYGTL
jgi:hypothetical protein